MDAPEPQQVKQDGEQHNQKTDEKQIVIVNEGEAPPVGVTSTEAFLLDVSEKNQRGNRHKLQVQLCLPAMLPQEAKPVLLDESLQSTC